jgi:hypothetical protein
MLKSNTEEETVKEYLLKASYVQKIFNNPQYYAGYYLRQIEGNLYMMGSAPTSRTESFQYL